MADAGTANNDALEKGVKQPLLISSQDSHENDGDEDGDQDEEDGSEEAPEELRKAATSLTSAYRLLTPSVKASNFNWISISKFLNVNNSLAGNNQELDLF